MSINRMSAMAGAFVVAVSLAASTVNTPVRAAPGAALSCRPDHRLGNARAMVKTYRDPVGDAEAGHADITGVQISDASGVVTFGIDVRNLSRDVLVITFDTTCDNHEDYVLSFDSRGSGELDRINLDDEMFQMGAPAISSRPSRNTVRVTTYTLRFSSSYFGKATAFRFEAHVDTARFADVSDNAPDDGYWYYDLLSR